MTIGKKIKISSSAYRVLLLLLKLNEGDYSADELNKFFIEDPYVARLFSKDVILKYINTLKLAGYDISRQSNNSYKLNNAPVLIDFSDDELKTLAILDIYTKSLHQKRFVERYKSFLDKIKKYMTPAHLEKFCVYYKKYSEADDEIFSRYDKYLEVIQKIEQYIIEKQRVEIKYKLPSEDSEKPILAELQGIKYGRDEVCVNCYNLVSNQINSIKLAHITEIRQLPTVSKLNQVLCPVLFKIKGTLAEIYRPYEGEKLSEPDKEGHIIVTTHCDDEEALFKRLLRYGNSCEILYPKMIRDKMKAYIKNIIENYKQD